MTQTNRSQVTPWCSFLVLVFACSEPVDSAAPLADSGLDAGALRSDASSIPEGFSAQAWTALQELSPPGLPEPPFDPTNPVADHPGARALGRSLFFDPGFSGKLLDSDNDGSHGGTGLQGEAGKVSCASCHMPEQGFSDFRTHEERISLGAGWTRRRAPAIFDVGHATLLMWDGRFDSLQRQALAVFESPLEGNSSRLFVAQEIARRYATEYQAVFGDDPRDVLQNSYPQLTAETTGCSLPLDGTTTPDPTCSEGELHGMPGDNAEFDGLTPQQQARVTEIALNAGRAIGAYERKIRCGKSRFDIFMAGNEKALTASEKRGAALFVEEAGCVTCHNGPFLSDQEFHNVGVRAEIIAGIGDEGFRDEGALIGLEQLIEDPLNSLHAPGSTSDGRVPNDVDPAKLGAFRTPMLRCVTRRPSYMHAGNLQTLEEVVTFFNEGGHASDSTKGYLGQSEIEPLGLSEQDERDLVAFLKALDGVDPLDPDLLP